MLVSGKNVAVEVLNKAEKVRKVFLWEKFNDEKILSLLKKMDINPIYKQKYELDQIVKENHQGIIIDIDDYKYCDLSTIIKQRGFIVMLDHIEDPHNFGAIIRTCEAAGVDGIIITKDRSVEVNGTVMKTSAGALENIKICLVTNLVQTIKELKKNDYWIYGTDMQGKKYTEVDYSDATCMVIGSEGFGMSDLVKKNCDEVVSIPMYGKINSLNASVAAGVLVYEVVRQRNR